MSFRWH